MNSFKTTVMKEAKRKGLTQRALAEYCGVSEVTYGRYLDLERTMSLSAFMLTCEQLCIVPTVLFKSYTYARMEKRVRDYIMEQTYEQIH